MRCSTKLLAASDRIYRVLLHTYPHAFRAAYGSDMAQLFRDSCRDSYQQQGGAGLARLWLRTLGDIAISAGREHVNGGTGMVLKRLFDITFALASLLVLAPLFVLIALLIKLGSRGPVLYKDLRVGKNGRLFHMYKFRTMVTHPTSTSIAGQPNPRITSVGARLRALSLDEAPQYFNVLKGDMSLIGPRPPRPGEVRLDDPAWQRALSMRPGMTGPALLSFGPGARDLQRIRDLDIQYVESRSMRGDLGLLLQTLAAIIGVTR